jgi:hypothetical protein
MLEIVFIVIDAQSKDLQRITIGESIDTSGILVDAITIEEQVMRWSL